MRGCTLRALGFVAFIVVAMLAGVFLYPLTLSQSQRVQDRQRGAICGNWQSEVVDGETAWLRLGSDGNYLRTNPESPSITSHKVRSMTSPT